VATRQSAEAIRSFWREAPSVSQVARNSLVVAMDGPSGVGKSTLARLLSARLGVPYLDTGAMYRALGLKAIEMELDPDDAAAVANLAATTALTLEPRQDGRFAVLVDGSEIGDRARGAEVGEITSRLAAHPAVRARLVALQRDCASRYGGVVEGRDIGTRVFPDTPHKFFLDARPEVRFRRRYEERRARGEDVSMADVVEEITRRDYRDTHRADSPLLCDPSYTLIDTSDLAPKEIVERMREVVRRRQA
jgi:CMP/dCMP kinase